MASLVAEWKFDEGTGTVLHDSSGNGLDGTLGGSGFTAPTWISGGGLSFNGVNDAVVVPNPAPLHLPNAHSIVCIFKWTSGNSGLYDRTGVGNATNKSYQIQVEGGNFKARVEKGGNVDCTDGALVSGTLYNFTYTWNGTTMNVYKNGVFVISTGVAAPIDNPASGDVLIGHLGSGVFPLNGSIYYLAVYDYALTQGNINDFLAIRASAERTTAEYTGAEVLASGLRRSVEYTDNTVRTTGLRTIVDYTAATSIVSALRTIWEYEIGPPPVPPPGDTGLPPPPPVTPCPDTNLGQGPPVQRGCEVQIGGIPTTGTPLTYGVGFRLYRKDCEIRMKNWGAIDSYSIAKPFGGESFERGAMI